MELQEDAVEGEEQEIKRKAAVDRKKGVVSKNP
jgi:hypothetical protein